jgi:ribosomal protein L7/L12
MTDFFSVGTPILLIVLCFSLFRSERRLAALERNLGALLRHLNVDPTAAAGPPSDRVKALAADPKRKIDAIRLYRRETGADLRQAKAMVESIAPPG